MKRLNATRQQRIAGLVSVGILAMVVYITGSVFEWQLYNDSTKNASSHAKSVVTKALEPSAKTPAQNQKVCWSLPMSWSQMSQHASRHGGYDGKLFFHP